MWLVQFGAFCLTLSEGCRGAFSLLLSPKIEAALDECFDAVVRPQAWGPAMEALASALEADGCCFNTPQGAGRRLHLPASSVYRDMLTEFVGGGWAGQDLRAARGWPRVNRGQAVVFESDLTTQDERDRSQIYNDFFRRIDLEAFCGVAARIEGQSWILGLARPARAGWFNDDGEVLARVQPSIRRLLVFAGQMSMAATRGMMTAFEHAPISAVLIDREGRVAGANLNAETLFGAGLDVRAGRLVAADPTSNRALQGLIETAKPGGLAGVAPPACIYREDADPLVVEAIPLNSDRADAFGMAGALLLIRDLGAKLTPDGDLLQRAFGLTPRERDVAVLLADGLAANEIGERLALRTSSVQQVIKTILAKTGATRQGALIAKLAQLRSATQA